MVGRIVAPQRYPGPNLQTWIFFYGKLNFADLIKNLKKGRFILDYPSRSNVII